jgi:hypothetical protein
MNIIHKLACNHVKRCNYNYDYYGCSQMHILMLKAALFHNSIQTSAETKT